MRIVAEFVHEPIQVEIDAPDDIALSEIERLLFERARSLIYGNGPVLEIVSCSLPELDNVRADNDPLDYDDAVARESDAEPYQSTDDELREVGAWPPKRPSYTE